MPLEAYVGQLEPENQDAVIWRYVNMKKFRDFMKTQELYFCRADLFTDQSEGLPPENYKPFPHLNPLDLNDRRQIDDSIGNVAQFREAFYINCWHLFREETCKMWEQYGEDGQLAVGVLAQGIVSLESVPRRLPYRHLHHPIECRFDRAAMGNARQQKHHHSRERRDVEA